MVTDPDAPLAPTVEKVIERFVDVLRADGEIDQGAVERLDVLLRTGKIPKPEELEASLFSAQEFDKGGTAR